MACTSLPVECPVRGRNAPLVSRFGDACAVAADAVDDLVGVLVQVKGRASSFQSLIHSSRALVSSSGVAGDGESITCKDNDGLRWEPS